MNIQMLWKLTVAASYLSIIGGSAGMIVFAMRFPFSSSLRDLRYANERFLRLNGYTLWVLSWSLIVAGTSIQFLDYIFASCGL